LGYNKYGQLGISNSLYLHAEEPVEIFTDGLRFKQIAVGAHHNLLLSEDGELYGFGARMNGQLDGINYDGREE
jgi:alpha-tubulin suppressor-like RCC1 family protein